MEYTITLNDAQKKALETITYDPQIWIENMVYERCRIAMDEIVQSEVERITSTGGELKGTKEDIVLAAPIKSAKQITDETTEQMKATQV